MAGGTGSALATTPPAVACTTPTANHLQIAITGTSTSASDPLTISVSGGNYVISVGTTTPTSECTGTTYADSGTSGYPNVKISSTSGQYVILDDSNGQLASQADSCPAQFTTGFPGTLEADGDASPAVQTDATIALGSSALTLSQSCSSADVSLGSGVNTVVVAGKASGASNTLDLSSTTGSLTVNADASPGTVTGFTNSSVTAVDFTGEQNFIGSSGGGNTFIAGTSSASFKGSSASTLDLSALSSPTVNVTGNQVNSQANDTAAAGGATDTFSGITSFQGATTGNTTFLAGNTGGFTFGGRGSGNVLDLSALTTSKSTPGVINEGSGIASAGPVSDTFNDVSTFSGPASGNTTFLAGDASGLAFTGQNSGNTFDLSAASSGVTIDAKTGLAVLSGGTDSFSAISDFVGSSKGGNTFIAGMNSVNFKGFGTSTLDFSALTSPIVNVTGNSVNSQLNNTVAGGGASAPTDAFTGVTSFKGPSNTTFLAGNTGGFSFDSQGSGNILDLSAASSGVTINANTGTAALTGGTDSFSAISEFVGSSTGGNTFIAGTSPANFRGISASTLDLSGLTSPTVNVTGNAVNSQPNDSVATGGTTPTTDTFSGITSFRGPTTGNTKFLAGKTGGLTFTGQGSSNTLDLSAISGLASLTVAMSGGTCGAGSGLVTGATPSLTDCFAGIDTVKGAAAVPTTFQPDPNLVSTPTSPVRFIGNDTASGGSIVDLSNINSPDSSDKPVSALEVLLHGNSAASPGQATATVGSSGTSVVFASFSSINRVIGSSHLTTGFDPGTTSGVALSNITPAPQAITFTSTPPSPATVGGSYAPHATGGLSGSEVVFSVSPSSNAACTLTGSVITFTRPGTCQIVANQAGNSEYQSAPQAQQTITVTAVPGQQILALLTSGLTSSTKAHIGALLRTGGLRFTFSAPEAGTATIAWYQLPPRGHLASSRKPVLVAIGRLVFHSGGAGKMQLRLTPAGRKLLRHAQRLRLTVKGTFTPPWQSGMTVLKAFTLTR